MAVMQNARYWLFCFINREHDRQFLFWNKPLWRMMATIDATALRMGERLSDSRRNCWGGGIRIFSSGAEALGHACYVLIDGSQTILPTSALIWPWSVSDICDIHALCFASELCPCLSCSAVRLKGFLESIAIS